MDFHDRGKDELRNTHTSFDNGIFASQVNQNYLDLSPVIGIDGPGCIEGRNTLFDRKAAPGPHLDLIFGGDTDDKTGGNELPLARSQNDR